MPCSVTTRPSTRTRPATMSCSAARRDATPAPARTFCRRTPAIAAPRDSVKAHMMRRVDKPWGYEIVWAETDRYVGKILHIDAGQKLSRQYHVKKDETFLVEQGEMDLEVGRGNELRTIRMRSRESFHCPPGTVHRMVA